MIYKSAEYENGYVLSKSSRDRELQALFDKYGEVKCVIMNRKTARNFRCTNGRSIVTVNNRLADGVFFVNKIS